MPGSKDAPLEVTPIVAQNLVALMLNGPKVTRIAVADLVSGTWHSQDLRKPIDGRAVPIIAADVVVYTLGRDVYAYGAAAHRWDVAELPEGTQAVPSVGSGTATIEEMDISIRLRERQVSGDHVDVRALLDGKAGQK